ncbi:DUF4352 domain-containing protein [Patescibacteria group bacterium]
MRKNLTKIALVIALACAVSLVLAGCGDEFQEKVDEASQDHANEEIALDASSSKAEIYDFDATGEVAAKNVTMDYYPTTAESSEEQFTLDIIDPKNTGDQYIRFDVDVTNTGTDDLPFYDGVDFKLQTSAGGYTDSDFMTGLEDQAEADVFKDVSEIPAGETVSGAVYFQVSEGETFDDIKLFYESSKSDPETFEFTDEKIEIPLVK